MKNKNVSTVAIGILTYNHEKYIAECVDSVLAQTGNFSAEAIVLDDCSTDKTEQIVREKIRNQSNVKYIRNQKNLGIQKNLRKLLAELEKTKCDYVTIIEGDDYYFSNNRIQKHLDCYVQYPETLFTYNKLLRLNQETGSFDIFAPDFVQETITTSELAECNHIGNLGAAFYSKNIFQYLDDNFWKNEVYDWFLHIYLSQFGEVMSIEQPLSVYRLHEESFWSPKSKEDKNKNIQRLIDTYDDFFGYKYSWSLQHTKNISNAACSYESLPIDDIAIISGIFPAKSSGFSYIEFTEILNKFSKAVVYATGKHLPLINESIEQALTDYKNKYKIHANNIRRYYDFTPIRAKLLYGIFLSETYDYILPVANTRQIPFVFTLYPDGGMKFYDREVDKKLREIFSSPYFQKVICTQQPVVDYLLKKKLCKEKDIEFIFGVVTPRQKPAPNKRYFDGKNKKTLDIVFVSHKYKNPSWKGYDIFIETAKKLSALFNDITFHVVGGYEKGDMDIKGIKSIKFYGTKDIGWFRDFYKNIDIIISPTDRETKETGVFDGFPTASTTDAGLNGVAMLATDPLKMNNGNFREDEEIIIIQHDVDDVVKKAQYLHDNPERLKTLGQNGQRAVSRIYSYDSQIKSRLKILDECLQHPIICSVKPTIKRRIYNKGVHSLRTIARRVLK